MVLQTKQTSSDRHRQLVDYLQTMYKSFHNHKQSITELLYKCRRQRQGVYEADILQAIRKFGGSEEFVKLTARKCQIAESWLVDAFINNVENSWNIKSSLENATGDEAAKKMTSYITEQLHNGGFKKALNEFILDICTYPAAILKGPVINSKNQLKYIKNNSANSWQIAEQIKAIETFQRVSPFDFFPAPNCKDISYADVIERFYLSATEISHLSSTEYYNKEAIEKVINEYYNNQLADCTKLTDEAVAAQTVNQVNGLQNEEMYYNSHLIGALEFRCQVPAKLLPEEFIEENNLAEHKVYDMWIILIGNHIVKLQLNADVLSRRPYFVASFCENNDSIWGEGIPQKIVGPQRAINATKRALINNLAIASGPQVTVNLRSLPPESKITKMHPWKIWQYKGDGVSGNPFEFFQPDCNTELLLKAIDRFSKEADEDSGIPPYLAGDGNSNDNVMNTVGGLSMMVNISSKSIRRVISNIDQKVIIPLITTLYNLNMLDEECPNDFKGDLTITATGIYGALVNERNNEEQIKQIVQLLENDDVKALIDDSGIRQIVKKLCDLAGIPSNVLKIKKDNEYEDVKSKSK
ncbi:hypothetical protein AAEX28_12935 [Lentisphaerota bacterium WC36G]|nr:hypothetical protein LJT99_15755 [Lentisphaerae bacterium WC36]